MRVRKVHDEAGSIHYELLDNEDRPVPDAEGFLRHLKARDCSPNTVSAYAHDLKHFFTFLQREGLSCEGFCASDSLPFLEYLRSVPSRRSAQRLSPTLVSVGADREPVRRLSPTTVNRVLATVSSFYEYVILSGRLEDGDNPIRKQPDPAYARVGERHKPFIGKASRQSWPRAAAHFSTRPFSTIGWEGNFQEK